MVSNTYSAEQVLTLLGKTYATAVALSVDNESVNTIGDFRDLMSVVFDGVRLGGLGNTQPCPSTAAICQAMEPWLEALDEHIEAAGLAAMRGGTRRREALATALRIVKDFRPFTFEGTAATLQSRTTVQ